MHRLACALILALVLVRPAAGAEADTRKMVELPPPMREHMMANMRDHLKTLDLILDALSRGEARKAADLAESRLGMSSLDAHGADHMAPFMPERMRELGTSLHKAASRFAITARDAELEAPDKGGRMVFGALREMTAACEGCHAGFRVR